MLAQKLHMTQEDILNKMGADEFYNWIAFDMLKDENFYKKVKLLISQDMNKEARARAIKDMFIRMGNGVNR